MQLQAQEVPSRLHKDIQRADQTPNSFIYNV